MGSSAVGRNKLRYVPPSKKDGKLVVHLESNKFQKVHKQYEKLVVRGSVGRRPLFMFVKEELEKIWNMKQGFIMKPYGDRCFSFEFKTKEDKEKVLEIGCLHVVSQLFVVRPWQFFVEAKLENMETIHIWVIFKKFPMVLWDDEGISIVGSLVRNPLLTDKLTKERKRTNYARICVETGTKCKYPNTVTVVVDNRKAYSLPIEYNWRPQKCDVCNTFGHTASRCCKNKANRTTLVWL